MRRLLAAIAVCTLAVLATGCESLPRATRLDTVNPDADDRLDRDDFGAEDVVAAMTGTGGRCVARVCGSVVVVHGDGTYDAQQGDRKVHGQLSDAEFDRLLAHVDEGMNLPALRKDFKFCLSQVDGPDYTFTYRSHDWVHPHKNAPVPSVGPYTQAQTDNNVMDGETVPSATEENTTQTFVPKMVTVSSCDYNFDGVGLVSDLTRLHDKALGNGYYPWDNPLVIY